MLLSEIRNQVAAALDYDAAVTAWKRDVDRHVNRALGMLWTLAQWTFAVREKDVQMPAPITSARDTANLNVATGRRLCTFSRAIDRLDRTWEGQPIRIKGYDYVISRVGPNRDRIELDRQYIGTTDTGDTTFEARFRYFTLPPDAQDLLDVVHVRNDTRTPLYQEQEGILVAAGTPPSLGTPTHYAVVDPLIVPPAGKLAATTSDPGHAEGFRPGYVREFAWAFDRAGHAGPLSQPLSVTMPTQAASYQVDLAFLALNGDPVVAGAGYDYDLGPVEWEALRKRVYFNANMDPATGTSLGLPVWIECINAGPSATRNTDPDWMQPVIADDTASTITLQYRASLTPDPTRGYAGGAHHIRFRLWPEPDMVDWSIPGQAAGAFNKVIEDYYARLLVRYRVRAPVLARDTDAAPLPPDMDALLVHLATALAAEAKGDDRTAARYRGLFERMLPTAERRWTARRGPRLVRGAGGLFGDTRAGPATRPRPPLVRQ